ncbi:MAG: FxDxF family PEP-CTERM protein [Sphingomonadaceae bacterium]
MNFATIIKSIAVAAALVAGSAHASNELITNGSFEALNGSDTLTSGNWSTYSSIPGWISDFGIEVRHNVAGAAADRNYFVELDTDRNSSMQQLVGTTLGQHYTLSFAFQDREHVDTNSQGIQVLWGTQDLGTFNNSSVWKTMTFDVVGTGSNVALTFLAAGNSDSYGTSLDSVSLTSAVPEPETYGMLLAGLGLVGFAARRKAAK